METERLLLNFLCLLLLGSLYRILKNSVRQIGYLEFYSLIWGCFILGAQAMGKPYSPNLTTTFVFYSAWLFFLLPSFGIYSGYNEDQPTACPMPGNQLLYRVRQVLFVLVILSLMANGWMIYRIAGDLNLVRFGLLALRFQGQHLLAEQSTVFFQLFARNYVIYLPMAVWLYRYKAIRFPVLLLIGLFAFLTAATTLTRAPILVCTMSLFTSFLVFFRPNHWLSVGFGLGLFIILIGLTMGLTHDTDALRITLATYFWGSSPAFESLLDGRFPDHAWYDMGLYSTDFLNYTLKKMHLISTYPLLVRPYAPILVTTNVYTYLDAMTLDFGLVGALISASSLGGLAAYLHRIAHQYQSPFVVAYYGFINYAIAISIMNNELIRINAFLLAIELWLLSHFLYPKSKASASTVH